MANGWLSKDPFLGYKAKLKVVERPYLTKDEIQAIYEKEFASDRLNQVRDIFLFSCYTGLAYVDVKQLSKSNINIGIDGDQWILHVVKKLTLQQEFHYCLWLRSWF
jgi:hypothetical protein